MSENTTSTIEKNSRIQHALNIPQTDRTFDQYVHNLGLKIEDLGMTVLDIGSGLTEQFARTASLSGIEVFSINPKLRDPYERELREEALDAIDSDMIPTKDVGLPTIALAQNLPFSDETFDSIVSLWTLPHHIPYADYKKSFSEVMRVLKPSGKGFFGPIKSQRKFLEELLEEMKIKHEFGKYNEDFDAKVLSRFTLKIEK